MTLSAKLELRQGQQLVMTPQLQQAIRLLQLSNQEINQFVESELERNPLLELEESANQPNSKTDSEPTEANAAEKPAPEDPLDRTEEWLDLGKPQSDEAALDTDYENVFADPDSGSSAANGPGDPGWASLRQTSGSFNDETSNPESYVSNEPTLREHLSEQLPLAVTGHVERLLGQYLIDLVDEAGYLQADIDQLVQKLGATHDVVEGVLSTLQTFDPPGVFARSLGECLALQLKEQNRYDPQIAALLDNLDLLADRNITALRKAVGADMDELADMIDEIKRLDPKPGLRFGSVQVQAVVPDVLVRPGTDGSWLVELNNDTLPRVLVNRTYFSKVSKTAQKAEDRDYLLDCLQTANWLVKSLDQRARTILKVSEEIVRQQDAFFTFGVQHLRPLNLKTVADAISMHESTVSRVTSNKYMATPRGIFELKYFFTSAIAGSGEGETHSSEAVRHRIKALIDSETAKDVLSDDKIVEKLRNDGIDIARRTVAKYREAMRIPSSVQRRREKKLTEQITR